MSTCHYCNNNVPSDSKSCPSCGSPISNTNSPIGNQNGPNGTANNYQSLPINTLLVSKYRIDKVLGQGGFGITYLGIDVVLNRKVAIKEHFPEGAYRQNINVIISSHTINNDAINDFIEEGRSLAKLGNNPNIVKVYDIIQTNGTAYIVMEFVEGKSLSELMGKIDEDTAINYVKQIALALKEVHRNSMLHQDIKPQNLILTKAKVMLIDFGSARIYQADKTKTYNQILTPGYAPLEQYGEHIQRGPYTDIYALCATLYALLKGMPPPPATDISQGISIDYNHLSQRVVMVLEKGLKARINERIKDADEFIGLIDGRKGDNGNRTNPKPTPKPSPKTDNKRQHRALYSIYKIIGTLIILIIVFFILKGFLFPLIIQKRVIPPTVVPPGPTKTVHPSPRPVKIIKPQPPQSPVMLPPSAEITPPRISPSITRITGRISKEKGFKYFKIDGCMACHKVDGRGGSIGPDLSRIGRKRSLSWIKTQIVNPAAHFAPGRIVMANGKPYRATMPPQKYIPGSELNTIAMWVENLK